MRDPSHIFISNNLTMVTENGHHAWLPLFSPLIWWLLAKGVPTKAYGTKIPTGCTDITSIRVGLLHMMYMLVPKMESSPYRFWDSPIWNIDKSLPKPIWGVPVPIWGLLFWCFFSVTHKIGLFSPKIEAIQIALLPLPMPLPPLLLLLLPPPQAATPAPPPLPLILRRVILSSCRVLLHPVC
jgi:hypothetical protein